MQAERRERLTRILPPLLGTLLLGAALVLLYQELRHVRFHDVMARLRELPRARLALSLFLTALSYAALSGYDVLALRYVRWPMAYRRIFFVSFLSYVLSHNIGALFGGGAVRYRLLSTWGLSALDAAKVVVFCMLTFWVGFFTLCGLALTLDPLPISGSLELPLSSLRVPGLLLLVAVAVYLAASARQASFRVRGLSVALPSWRLASMQVVLSTLDWALAAGVLYVLLPQAPGLSFLRFVGIFMLAALPAFATHVPAGLGIFETGMVLLLRPYLAADVTLGAVLAYRAIYYLLPLVCSAVLLTVRVALKRREALARAQAWIGDWAPQVVPRILGMTTFLGGAVLLFSGATPALPARMSWLRDVLPLPVVELSHFLGSLAGMALLILARGIKRRVDAAYVLTAALLALGIVVSLLKGLDYEEAVLLALMLAALLPCRRYFYRKSALFGRPLTFGWGAAVLFVLQGVIFLTLWSHRHLEYSNDLWWKFAFSEHAPRALRAGLGAVILLVLYSAARLIRTAPPPAGTPDAATVERARAVVLRSPEAASHLALLGDKSLLFNDAGDAFVMYAVQGKSWVAMGDPVGPESEQQELAWRFRELVDLHGGWTVFYQVSAARLPLYLDLGLSLLKLGEEARVSLATFSLEGHAHKHLRHTVHRMERERCSVTLVPQDRVAPLLPELGRVSDDWLAAKSVREKRFSLGFFDERYLVQTPVAVARVENRVVAFANVWAGAPGTELSIDLMRYAGDAPPGVMDYLFIELMLWGREQGFHHFNLGMAPLSGFESHPLAPAWSRLGARLFRHGEHFYNFEGLRQYKDKFDPDWQPRYLAAPGGLILPRVLAHVATLISGGLGGVVAR